MVKNRNFVFKKVGLVAGVGLVFFCMIFLAQATYVLVKQRCTSGEGQDSEEPPTEMADCGDIKSTLKRYLLDAGYDNNAASGIMGNIEHESGYSPKKLNGGTLVSDDFRLYTNGVRNRERYINGRWRAFGLSQWLGSRIEIPLQNVADELGVGVTTLKAQATFLIRQLSTNLFGSYYTNATGFDKFNGRTLQETTWIYYKHVTAPGSATCTGQSECCSQASIANGTCVYNAKKPPGWGGVNTLIANQSDYALAYKSFSERYNKAVRASKIDVSDCHLSDGGNDDGDDSGSDDGGNSDDGDSTSDPSDPSEPEPVPTVDPTTDPTQPIVTTGALGKQNASNALSQTDSSVKNTPWLSRSSDKKIGVYDNGDCCGSGCSLIAVANAYGAIKGYSASETASFANDLAAWTKTHVNSPSEDNTKKMLSHVNMSYTKVWSSKGTSEATKIEKIRQALANGGAIVAGGDREGTDKTFCTSSRISSGECVFTPHGHYVAIIGITSDNKLVIGNPGKSSGRTWIFPASTVLKYSNIGYDVRVK